MNPAYLHLALNHVVVIGIPFGMLLLAIGILKKSQDLKLASLWIFVIVGLVAIPVYLTGKGAEEVVEHLPDVSETQIEPHEEMGLYSLIGAIILGIASMGALVTNALRARLSANLIAISLLLSIGVSALLFYTAYLGGEINHPELRSDFQSVESNDEND